MHGKKIQREAWRKSIYSVNDGACIEVTSISEVPATSGDRHRSIGVRDSKDIEAHALWFSGRAWSDFVTEIKLSAQT